MDLGNLLLYGGGAIVLLIVIRKLFSGKKDSEEIDDPILDVSKRMQMTQSQVEKVLTCSQEAGWLVRDGFVVNENTPHKITAVLKKENYHCEFSNYYELEGKKVKKIVMELNGEWTVGKKSKRVKGRTNDAYQKWLDWNDSYEEELEKQQERLDELNED
ncbi:hypothetical protein N9X12_06195 [Alphaproteobacteria bacterium]|jgi:hypothetical protein|nr:hypothetical protein [Alphaproteobacteria bacterium]